jgi:hypothetical protein
LAEDTRIITFPSVWHAFRAEKVLNGAAVACALVPVPRELSSSCQGLAAKIAETDLERALALLDAEKVQMEKRGVKVNKA